MAKRLKDSLNSRYIEAANAMASRKARRRIVAYVESYDDVYFWRTVLSDFEDNSRYFEVMLPSKRALSRGKKAALMSLLAPEALGRDMIACVDADYDYLMQDRTPLSRRVTATPYVLHTYAYAIENLQCYAPSLHNVCVAATLNDHRIFDFAAFYQSFSEAVFPLFVWSIMLHRNGNQNRFSISDFCRVADPGGFNVADPGPCLQHVARKVHTKISELQRMFPNAKAEYLSTKADIQRLGVTPATTYLYIQGHHLFDTITAPIVAKVCTLLRQERKAEISRAAAPYTQKQNELSCYENSQEDAKAMLKKNTGYTTSAPFRRIQDDLRRYLEATSPSQATPSSQ